MLSFFAKTFEELNTNELYQILALRAEVFVVEQNCPYQDVDGKDIHARHVLAYQNGKLVAYARVLKKGVSYQDYVSIGRVVTANKIRSQKQGHALMRYTLEQCEKNFANTSIKISAQAHLEKFYNKHDFVATGEAYLEDGIPHIGMILKKTDRI